MEAPEINDAQVREPYRERAALERDYATKLQVIARKASEKRAKTTTSLVLGAEPTKVWDENTLRQRSGPHRKTWCGVHNTNSAISTLDNAYSQIIASMTLSAQDHVNLAEAVAFQVLDVLKSVEKKCDETKKKVGPIYYLEICDLTVLLLLANGFLSEIALQ